MEIIDRVVKEYQERSRLLERETPDTKQFCFLLGQIGMLESLLIDSGYGCYVKEGGSYEHCN